MDLQLGEESVICQHTLWEWRQQFAIENGHWNSELSYEEWWCSTALLGYQRVDPISGTRSLDDWGIFPCHVSFSVLMFYQAKKMMISRSESSDYGKANAIVTMFNRDLWQWVCPSQWDDVLYDPQTPVRSVILPTDVELIQPAKLLLRPTNIRVRNRLMDGCGFGQMDMMFWPTNW